ncbi:hypothetical protein GW17_00002743 [Ensete ventricosum]|nr:hypothetical protein GW17_00002743 [Ensete ventricosum]
MASRGVVWMSPKPGIDQVVTSGVKISELKLSCAPDVRSRSETVSKNQGAVPYAGVYPPYDSCLYFSVGHLLEGHSKGILRRGEESGDSGDLRSLIDKLHRLNSWLAFRLPDSSCSMPAIRRLYDVCKMSFSDNGPISSEALEHVRSVLGEISSFAITSCLLAFD